MTDNRDELMALAERIDRAFEIAAGRREFTRDDHGYASVVKAFSRKDGQAIVSALRSAAASAAVPVAVKALEWVRAHSDSTLSRAETVVDTYRVWTYSEAGGKWFWNRERAPVCGPFDSEEAAKTAAQADYEQRIRSALIATPVAAGVREALAWCVSEIELEFSRNRKTYPADPEKKKRFEEAKALASAGADKSSDPLLGKIPCRCFTEQDKRLCLEADRCYTIEAYSSDGGVEESRASIPDYNGLHPFEDATQIHGMSWNGFNLIGDDKSIKELRRIENRSSQLEQYSAAYESRITRLLAERNEAFERLKPFAYYFDLNDCAGRKNDDALEIPIRDLRAAHDFIAHAIRQLKEQKG